MKKLIVLIACMLLLLTAGCTPVEKEITATAATTTTAATATATTTATAATAATTAASTESSEVSYELLRVLSDSAVTYSLGGDVPEVHRELFYALPIFSSPNQKLYVDPSASTAIYPSLYNTALLSARFPGSPLYVAPPDNPGEAAEGAGVGGEDPAAEEAIKKLISTYFPDGTAPSIKALTENGAVTDEFYSWFLETSKARNKTDSRLKLSPDNRLYIDSSDFDLTSPAAIEILGAQYPLEIPDELFTYYSLANDPPVLDIYTYFGTGYYMAIYRNKDKVSIEVIIHCDPAPTSEAELAECVAAISVRLLP